jgi:hypothetical protein
MLSIEQIADKVEALQYRYANRDMRMREITAVRKGDMESVYPEMFPEGLSKPMIANFVDVVARDLAEMLAPLPSFNCSTVNSTSDAAKKAADKRSMIANNYVQSSGLQTQMYSGADWGITYAFLPIIVEPDFDARMPRIRVENPMGAYPEYDRYGRCVSYTKNYIKTIRELIVDFPEHESRILGPQGRDLQSLNAEITMVRYEDKDQITLFLPQRGNLVLRRAANPIGRLSVIVPRRPGIDPADPRGQFDDVLWVQIARARFSLLAMEAAEKSVQSPIVVPNDVGEFAYGSDAIIRTESPQGVRRVGLELPTGAFTEQSVLEQEMRMGSRYPEGRSGNMQASVITGSGINALMGSFDTQIKAMQTIFAEAFEQVIAICFEMDEKLFPGKKKQRGTFNGAPYEFEYDPAKDIAGERSIQVRYGLMAGLDPSRALIFSLQALQAKLVSRDFVMRELPWSMNVSGEQERMDIETIRDNLSASLAGLAQAIPAMATQGQDPSDIVEKIAKVIDERRKGTAIEDAVMKVFKKPEPVAPPAAPQPSPEQQLRDQIAMNMGRQPEQPMEQPAPEVAQQAPQQQQAPDLASILSQIGGM